MRKLIHRAITILLMLSFGISAMMYFFFDVAQFHYKTEAHSNIAAKQELRLIKLPLKDFMSRADNEVWDNGKLYDVSSYIIVNDTASIWVFHDQDEEHLINAIVNSFEPNEQYNCDNTVHIYKHKVHTSDGKVLVTPFTIKFIDKPRAHYSAFNLFEHSFPVCLAVIKPPPEALYA